MAGERPYAMQLAEAIEARSSALENQELPQLKEGFRVFHASFQGLHQLLVRKGLVKEDPYKSDQKISEIKVPDDDPYLDSEREMVIGMRLDAFDNVLEFLNNYFEFRIQTLGFRELKQLTDLTKFVDWKSFMTHSPRPTTRGAAEIVGRARGGNDSFAASVITDALDQLARKATEIQTLIKTVSAFKREEYKLEVRERLLPSIDSPESIDATDPSALDKLKRQAKQVGMSPPFVPELVAEVLREEFGEEAEALREQALGRLKTVKKVAKKKRPTESGTDLLIAAIRGLASASRQLDVVADRLAVNHEAVANRSKTFAQKFRDWVDRLTNRQPPKVTYTVSYTDENTGSRHSEPIVFSDFLELIRKKAKLYNSFLARTGSPWLKLQKASEEQLQKYLDKELGDLHGIHRRAGALDTHLKEQVSDSEKRTMKGVKIELTAVRNAIVSTNQAKHEYTAKKSELDQMRKLGIDV